MQTLFRGGEHRKLGNLPRTLPVGEATFAPHYGEKQFKILPRDKWQPMTSDQEIVEFVDRCIVPTGDQNGEGACGAYSAAAGIYHARDQAGLDYTQLAAGRLYHFSGGGRDSGSQLSDNLRYAQQYGIPKFRNRNQELNYRSNWDDTEEDEGQLFKILGAVDCPSFEYLACAIQGPCNAVIHGILCGSNYDVDDSGIWIRPARGQSGGHAQCTPSGGLCYVRDTWGLLVQGSWSSNFGYKGWYVVPESYFTYTPFTDGWGLYAVTMTE